MTARLSRFSKELESLLSNILNDLQGGPNLQPMSWPSNAAPGAYSLLQKSSVCTKTLRHEGRADLGINSNIKNFNKLSLFIGWATLGLTVNWENEMLQSSELHSLAQQGSPMIVSRGRRIKTVNKVSSSSGWLRLQSQKLKKSCRKLHSKKR